MKGITLFWKQNCLLHDFFSSQEMGTCPLFVNMKVFMLHQKYLIPLSCFSSKTNHRAEKLWLTSFLPVICFKLHRKNISACASQKISPEKQNIHDKQGKSLILTCRGGQEEQRKQHLAHPPWKSQQQCNESMNGF